jgi:ubiquinone/menaquinone biosynthesis C-methylase UbiE
MRELDERLLESAALEPGDDVLVLAAGGELVFAAHERVGDEGWVYVVHPRADALEALLAEAHANGTAGLAYLVGDAAVLPLPDEAVSTVISPSPLADSADLQAASRELYRVLRAGGRLALAAPDAATEPALRDAGFADVVAAADPLGAWITARKP